MYEFSAPMPSYEEHIDSLVKINETVEKSKITNLYFALPCNCKNLTGFEQIRTNYKEPTDFDFWAKKITYTMEKGFDFVYLLNSPKPLPDDNNLLENQLSKLDILINNLKKIGGYKLRITNPQVIDYVVKNYPEMELYSDCGELSW